MIQFSALQGFQVSWILQKQFAKEDSGRIIVMEIEKLEQLLNQKRKESAGKDPMGLAAAALYLSCVKNGMPVTQREIAEAADVTEVTIRNRYKSLKEAKILESDL